MLGEPYYYQSSNGAETNAVASETRFGCRLNVHLRMTLPGFANPWSFPCAFTDPCDRYPIRPVGRDMTGTRWVSLVVPPVLARELANRWSEGKGFIEVSTERAAALL